jgi:hypothetical protein
VDDYGDDYGLRVKPSPSFTVLVADLVHRCDWRVHEMYPIPMPQRLM